MTIEREERTAVFYLVVFHEYTSGAQQRVMASISSLMRFIETESDNTKRGVGSGPYDVFYVDTVALEVAVYDTAPLLALSKPKPRRRS
jgi:hypothetical protein